MATRIYVGDCREVLRTLEAESVDSVVTSPPYFGLRDYGTATWDGGDPACDHVTGELRRGVNLAASSASVRGGGHKAAKVEHLTARGTCPHCGAVRRDRQIGIEATLEDYVAELVAVFREVRRVLRPRGTVWLNLGDTYNAYNGNRGESVSLDRTRDRVGARPKLPSGAGLTTAELKPKDLLGIPWRVAFALQADGWFLRSDIIWHKPNPMPESVTDRPTKAHEYLFLLTKSDRYYYNAAAIAEPLTEASLARVSQATFEEQTGGPKDPGSGNRSARRGLENLREAIAAGATTRNARTVWTIATKPFAGAHFATFPPELAERCVLAGVPPAGKRCDCDEAIYTPTGSGGEPDPSHEVGRAGFERPRNEGEGVRAITRREQRHHARELRESPHRDTIAAELGQAFDHYVRTDDSGARPLPEPIRLAYLERGWITNPGPCACPIEPAGVVLDPFTGSGTTGVACALEGVEFLGIEKDPEFAEIARERIEHWEEFGEDAAAPRAPVDEKQGDLFGGAP